MKNLQLVRLLVLFYIFICFEGMLQSQIIIEPETFHFNDTQKGLTSAPHSFVIVNQGVQPIELDPSDIFLEGKSTQTTNLSVLTYNIEADDGNWPGRFAFILQEVRRLDVDIIGLQEVIQRATLDNQAMQIADSLGFYYYFDSVDDENNAHRYGNAIVSRYPIEETNYRALQPLNRFRTALHVVVNVNGYMVDVYNTHLHHRPLDHHIRMEQVMDFLDFIQETKNGQFAFITGDFNANPDWDEMQPLYENFQDVYPLFHENHLDPEHATLNYKLGHQMRRIDYVLFKRTGLESMLPLSAEIILNDEHEDPEMESDHFGVLAQFRLMADDTHFLLTKPQNVVELQPGENIQTEIAFSPHSVGSKEVFFRVNNQQASISAMAFDATISQFPWLEIFEADDINDTPFGWEALQGNWLVSATSFAGGQSPELFFDGTTHSEGFASMRTPPMHTSGLDSLFVSFRHSLAESENPGNYVLTLESVSQGQHYTIAQWENPGDITEESVSFTIDQQSHGVGEEMFYFVWSFQGQENDLMYWAIDDMEVQALPSLAFSVEEINFGVRERDTQSEPIALTLSNLGGGTIAFGPDDIHLAGPDFTHFTLHTITENVSLAHGETATVEVAFAPQATGEMVANISLLGKSVDLYGESFDATVTQLPWTENFSDQVQGGVPRGWQSDTRNWEAFMLSNAGGTPPEMVFWWEPVKTGRFYLKSPEIVTTGLDTLIFSFKYRVRNFGNPGIYKLSVIAIADEQEYIIEKWENPDFIHATELITIIDAQNHGVGSDSFRLAWVFEGTTDNMVSWDFDDIQLYDPGDDPIPEITPDNQDFGQQTIETTSEPVAFTLRNKGGGKWHITPEDITLTGAHASDFLLYNLEETIQLDLFETHTIQVAFRPLEAGQRSAQLTIHDTVIPLTGWGTQPTDYFIYSDFTIPGFTNVEGFREVPGWAQGISATDVSGQGEFGGVVLQLDYDLDIVTEFTSYWLWAFPSANISEYDHFALRIKAEQPITGARIQIFDTDGIQGTNGAAFTHLDIDDQWQTIVIPVEAFQTMEWASNLPDMSRIQRVDILLEKGVTQPLHGSIWVDLVAFSNQPVSVSERSHPLSFQIFPNPATQKVSVFAPKQSLLSVIDLNGKVLLSQKSKDEQTIFDISGLNSGIYIVRVQNERGGIMVKKLTVQ